LVLGKFLVVVSLSRRANGGWLTYELAVDDDGDEVVVSMRYHCWS